jgi:hypothetical protein
MHVEGFFEWLGQALGSLIRFIVDALSGLFNLLANAGGNFIDGLARTWAWTPRWSASWP